MIENGFEDVMQLDGGIINFCQQYPNTIWEGKCFVFDKRLMSDMKSKKNIISNCVNCQAECDLYKNCRHVECDELVVLCVKCQERLNGCCSEECMRKFLAYCNEKSKIKQKSKQLAIAQI